MGHIETTNGVSIAIHGWAPPDKCTCCGQPTQETFEIRIGSTIHRLSMQAAFTLASDLYSATYGATKNTQHPRAEVVPLANTP